MCINAKKNYIKFVKKKSLFSTVISVLDEPCKVAADLSIVCARKTSLVYRNAKGLTIQRDRNSKYTSSFFLKEISGTYAENYTNKIISYSIDE